jgi:hypothetical protein
MMATAQVRLPKGTLKAQDAKQLTEARDAGTLTKVIGFAVNPIQCFNECMFFPSFSMLGR